MGFFVCFVVGGGFVGFLKYRQWGGSQKEKQTS